MTTSPGWADSEAVIQALAALRRYSDARAQGKLREALVWLSEAEYGINVAEAALAKEIGLGRIIPKPQPFSPLGREIMKEIWEGLEGTGARVPFSIKFPRPEEKK